MLKLVMLVASLSKLPSGRQPPGRPAVTWLGGAAFNPLMLGRHVWGKKRRDANSLGRDATREGKSNQPAATSSIKKRFLSCLGLLKIS